MELSCLHETTHYVLQETFPWKPSNKSFIDQACSVKMAGYWPHSFFVSLWSLTQSWSINAQKQNLANIQPFWCHTWSITHVCFLFVILIWLSCSLRGSGSCRWVAQEWLKTEFARGPGRGDTCHLSNLDETLPDWRDYQTTLKDKVGRLCDFSLGS